MNRLIGRFSAVVVILAAVGMSGCTESNRPPSALAPAGSSESLVGRNPDVVFNAGFVFPGGWTVESVRRHPEFIRLVLVGQDTTTGLEIIPGTGTPTRFCSQVYCVQPAPGHSPPAELLLIAVSYLPRQPVEGFPKATIRPATKIRNAVMATLTSEALLISLAVALGVLILPVLFSAFSVSGVGWRRGLLFVVGACVVFCGVWYFTLSDPDYLATRLTTLQDGTTHQNLLHLYGQGVHSSPFSQALAGLVRDDPVLVTLRHVARFNLWLTAFNVALLFLVAAFVLNSIVLAAPLAAAFFLAYSTRVSSVSEYPAAPVTAILLLSVASAVVIARRNQAGRVMAWVAVAALAVASIIATGFRLEMALAAVLSVASAIISMLVSPARLESAGCKVRDWWAGVLRRPARALLPIGLMVAVSIAAALAATRLPPPLGWISGALNVFDDAWSTVPAFLARFNSVSLILLACAGVAASILKPLRFLMLPFWAIFLMRIHVEGTDDRFNHWMRLFSLDMPAVMIIAVFGLKLIRDRWVPAGVHPHLRALAVAALAWSVLILPAGSDNPGRYPFRMGHPGDAGNHANPQIEVNYLLRMMDRYPDCLFATRVLDHGEFKDVHFSRTLVVTDEPLVGFFDCQLFYRGLDCNFVDGPDCTDITEDMQSLDSLSFDDLPYGQIRPYLGRQHRPVIELGVFGLRSGGGLSGAGQAR